MKNVKKILTLVLATMLVAALMIPAFAAADKTITIDESTNGYQYKAYQIFSGTLDSTGTKLTDVAWASGVNSAALLAALQADTSLTEITSAIDSAAKLAEVLAGYTSDDAKMQKVADIVAANLNTEAGVSGTSSPYTITSLNPGYYFVKSTTVPTGHTHTRYILKVVGDTTVTPKSTDVPDIEKKVGTSKGSAAYSVGDSIPYVLTATLPDATSYDQYDTYKLVFTDTLSAGLTAPAESAVKVYLNDDSHDITSACTDIDVTGQVITVTINDVKATAINAAAGDKIIVKYSATLNDSAVSTVNENEVVLTYSNDPNNTPSTTTGTTPDDVAKVYTFDLNLTKTYEGTPSDQAKFTLYKGTKAAGNEVGTEKTVTAGAISWNNLADGTYVLSETYTPSGYSPAEDITFTITSTIDAGGNRTAFASDNAAVSTTFTGSDAQASTSIENKIDATLPSTGGTGTIIFVTLGSIAILAAGIFLVTNKRMSKEDI